MTATDYWAYSLAFVALVWAFTGLRSALGALAAHGVLYAVQYTGFFRDILFPLASLLPGAHPAQQTQNALLSFSYPLVWGLVYIALCKLPRVRTIIPDRLRMILGTACALAFLVVANWDFLYCRAGVAYASYLAPAAERHVALQATFAKSGLKETCTGDHGYALIRAARARDAGQLRVFVQAASACRAGSYTSESLRTGMLGILHARDTESLKFILDMGVPATTAVLPTAYSPALFYATVRMNDANLVRVLLQGSLERADKEQLVIHITRYSQDIDAEALRWGFIDAGIP